MRVEFSNRALREINDIHEYVSRDNPKAASKIILRIEELSMTLADVPEAGRVVRSRNTRVLVALPYPYLILYRVAPRASKIEVLRIVHGARLRRW